MVFAFMDAVSTMVLTFLCRTLTAVNSRCTVRDGQKEARTQAKEGARGEAN